MDGLTNVGSIATKEKVKFDFIAPLFRDKSYFISFRDIVIWAFSSVTNLKLLRSNDRVWGALPRVQDWDTVGNGWTQRKEIKVNDPLKFIPELALIQDCHLNKRYFHLEANLACVCCKRPVCKG